MVSVKFYFPSIAIVINSIVKITKKENISIHHREGVMKVVNRRNKMIISELVVYVYHNSKFERKMV